MKVFDIIPENYFSILVSKNKNIYLDAIFVLREVLSSEMSISKEEYANKLISSFSDEINNADFIDENDESFVEQEFDESDISGKAYAIIRKLKNTGWIDFEQERDTFVDTIIFPSYSRDFADVLYDLTIEKKVEYESFVFNIYIMLKEAATTEILEEDKIDNQKDIIYKSIIQAYKNTEKLEVSLKSLYNNIGTFHKKILKNTEVNEITKEHLLNYQEFSDSIIHPLITKDSVPRYRGSIIEFCSQILNDNNKIRNVAEFICIKDNSQNLDEIINDIYIKVDKIKETFEYINAEMALITSRNNEYNRAATNRISYLLTSDEEIKGKMAKFLRADLDDESLAKVSSILDITKVENHQKDAIYTREIKDKLIHTEKMKIETKAPAFDDLMEFAKKVENYYSNEKIKEYFDRQFQNCNSIATDTMTINSIDDVIMIIIALIRHEDKSLNYKISIEEKNIVNGGFKLPFIIFER